MTFPLPLPSWFRKLPNARRWREQIALPEIFFARAAIVSAGKNITLRYHNGYRDSAHWSQNKHNFPSFSNGLEFLNEPEKEKNNGKGNSASAPSRLASLSEGKMQQILTEKHSGKTKEVTNWSVSTFKGKLQFFYFRIVECKTRAFNRKIEEKSNSNFA